MGIAGPYLASREQRHSASEASAAEQQAAQLAVDEQRRQFDLTRSDMAPWLETGRGALNQLAASFGIGGMGSGAPSGPIDPNTGQPIGVQVGAGTPDLSGFFASPDYQFALDQGVQATTRAGSAFGNLRSGNTLAALTQYGQGLASQHLGNYRNTLMQLAGFGQGTANNLGVLGANMANTIGQHYTNAGNARASGILAGGAARANFFNQQDQNAAQYLPMFFGGYGRG